jgi:transcriptional regulator
MSVSETILHVGRRFRVADDDHALDLLSRHNLGSVISTGADGWPRASTSPLIIRPDPDGRPRLYAHIAKQNPQVEHLRERRPLLYVAQGPRAYVSPAWFPRRPAAPAYLHVTVHVRARPELLDDERTAWLLLETVETFERRRPRPWRYNSGRRFLESSARAVAGFELLVDGIEAACKLSQERSPEERALIAAALEESESSDERAIAAMLRGVTADHRPLSSGNETSDALREER